MSARITKTTLSPPTAPTAFPRPRTTFFRKTEAGFTLVEILIVLAIIAFIISLGMPAIERVTNYRLNSTTRRFIGLVRTIRNDSILLSSIHRLVVNFEDQTYWIESQTKEELLDLNAEPPKSAEEVDKNFAAADKYSDEPVPLPDGIVFEGLFKENEGFRREGVAYIHFFPNGYAEPAILFLNRPNAQQTAYAIELVPPMGKVEVYREDVARYMR